MEFHLAHSKQKYLFFYLNLINNQTIGNKITPKKGIIPLIPYK